MSVLISAVEMMEYNHCSIPGVIMVTFTNGEKVSYRQSDGKDIGISGPSIKLLNFTQPQFDLCDVKISEDTFQGLSEAYAEQLCILNTQQKSAFEEAERLYAKEKAELDDFYKSQHEIIEELWDNVTREMSRKYQRAKKMADRQMESLKDPAQRLEVVLRWLRKTKQRNLLEAAKLLESNSQYIIKRMQSPEIKWHSFLSHVQKDSADLSRNIRDTLLKKGMRLWYDKNIDRLDCYGMIDGVINSSMFTLILTKDYFSRPYCIFEYCVAVVTGKSVITVYEADPRHGGGAIGSFDLPGLFKHLMKHELIDINRNYWEAFISKLQMRIQESLTSAHKMILEASNSSSNLYGAKLEVLEQLSVSNVPSSILDKREFGWLAEKLLEESRRMKSRIFTSSKDGNTAKAFREKCDLRGATLTLIETIEGKVFGGFTSHSWDSKKKWGAYAAESSWLFTLRGLPIKKINIKPENIYRAVCDGRTEFLGEVHGPIFGNVKNQHDLFVSPGMDFARDVCFCEGPASYSTGIMSGNKKVHFTIKEWEVFQVENYKPVEVFFPKDSDSTIV